MATYGFQYPAMYPAFPMEPISIFSHGTSDANRQLIFESGRVKSGTHFLCSLIDGEVQTQSPHGPNLLNLQITPILELFQVPRLYGREIVQMDIASASYYNLCLVDWGTQVPNHFQLLDIKNNPYLTLDVETETYKVKNWSDGTNMKHYVSISVEKDILIPGPEQHWYCN